MIQQIENTLAAMCFVERCTFPDDFRKELFEIFLSLKEDENSAKFLSADLARLYQKKGSIVAIYQECMSSTEPINIVHEAIAIYVDRLIKRTDYTLELEKK